MTKKESAEIVLKYGNCRQITCEECFIPREGYDSYPALQCHIIHRYSLINNNINSKHCPFRARAIAAKYLAELEEDLEEDHD